MLAGWFGSLGPGLLAVALSGLTVMFLFILPRYSFTMADPVAPANLAAFVVAGVLISLLSRRMHRAVRAAEARAAGEREAHAVRAIAYEDACRRQREAESLAEVARTINTLDLDAALQKIVDSACTLLQGRITGALFVGVLPGRTFSADEVRLVSAFADQAAVVMANAQLYHDAEQANHAKDEFLAMLGHELRNPLGAITGAVEVVHAAGADAEAAGRARAVIERQAQHLSRLVDDLLDVGRVTTGKVKLNRRVLDLGDLVAASTSAWRATGRFARHAVTVETVSAWVDADETRVDQVLGNLVGNALKYTPPGGAVTVRVAQDEATAVLEVADTGAGIPSSLGDRVFDLFVQGDRALDRTQGGLGIGLTLVKALVGLHGGTVDARSTGTDQGSVFTARLPRVPAPPGPAPAAPRSPATPSRRIVVIEDHDDGREMLRVALTLAGHEVHEAPDGTTGIELIAQVGPDLPLVDIGLPGLDRYEVARRIRAGENSASVFLVALTGYGQAEDRQRARAAGFDAHLTKPVSPEGLAAVIAQTANAKAGDP